MNKQDFIKELTGQLKGIPEEDIRDVLYDYEEHFSIGSEEGRSEEELAAALGDPKIIAKQVRAGYMVKKAKETASAGNIVKAVFATVGLGFFNIIIVLGPFLGLVGVLFGLFAAAISITVAGVATFVASILQPFLSQYINIGISTPAAIFISIGLTAFGLLFLIGNWYIVKLFYNLTIKYLKMNVKIITGKED